MDGSGVTIVLVDDHPILVAALGAELERSGVTTVAVEPAGDADEVLNRIRDSAPDVAVVDLGLPLPGGGQSLIPPLVAGEIPVVVLTGESERWQWAQATHAGAEVVLSKAEPLGDIIETLLRVARHEPVRRLEKATLNAEFEQVAHERLAARRALDTLSRREQEILAGLMDGYAVQRLAERDYVSVQTVRSQVKSLLRKLGVSSQLEAVAMAHAAGWLPDQQAS